jgi:hypothetical protein
VRGKHGIKNAKVKRGGGGVLELKELNHRPVILNTTRTPKRPSRRTTALNIRMSCVLGSKIFHTKTQRATISDIRKIKDIKSVNIVI